MKLWGRAGYWFGTFIAIILLALMVSIVVIGGGTLVAMAVEWRVVEFPWGLWRGFMMIGIILALLFAHTQRPGT